MAFEGIGGVITLGTWGGGYWFLLSSVNLRFWRELVDVLAFIVEIYIYLDLYFKKNEKEGENKKKIAVETTAICI